jgi:hypothetical protein
MQMRMRRSACVPKFKWSGNHSLVKYLVPIFDDPKYPLVKGNGFVDYFLFTTTKTTEITTITTRTSMIIPK